MRCRQSQSHVIIYSTHTANPILPMDKSGSKFVILLVVLPASSMFSPSFFVFHADSSNVVVPPPPKPKKNPRHGVKDDGILRLTSFNLSELENSDTVFRSIKSRHELKYLVDTCFFETVSIEGHILGFLCILSCRVFFFVSPLDNCQFVLCPNGKKGDRYYLSHQPGSDFTKKYENGYGTFCPHLTKIINALRANTKGGRLGGINAL